MFNHVHDINRMKEIEYEISQMYNDFVMEKPGYDKNLSQAPDRVIQYVRLFENPSTNMEVGRFPYWKEYITKDEKFGIEDEIWYSNIIAFYISRFMILRFGFESHPISDITYALAVANQIGDGLSDYIYCQHMLYRMINLFTEYLKAYFGNIRI